MSAKRQSLSLGDMPLYWRVRENVSDRHHFVPPRTAFGFRLDPGSGLVRQSTTPRLLSILKAVYEAEHNVGYLQDGHMLSKAYGDDLLGFIDRTVAGKGIRTVVEIGCGGCYLLERLSRDGFEVMGIDPSPVAALKGSEKGIEVISDFYPSAQATGPYDLILHADVLEHVDDPVGFLRLQRNQLREEGVVIISTPDCTRSIVLGDVSMALHQHLNYFDEHSLAFAVASAGLHVLTMERAKFGGSLYCSAARKGSPPGTASRGRAGETFLDRAALQLERFRREVDSLLRRGRTVGFYMPLRAMPYLAHLPHFRGLRIFDDTPHWHGKYFDGVDIPVENFQDFRAKPVDDLFVMSLTFGEVVKSKVAALRSEAKITTLPAFLEELPALGGE